MDFRFVRNGLAFLVLCGASMAADVLLIDDDNGANYEKLWMETLQSSDYKFDLIEAGQTTPELTEVQKYNTVIWVTGGRRNDLSSTDTQLIKSYIDSGGNLLVSGEHTGSALNWGWVDDRYFGFEFRKNSFHDVRVVAEGGFVSSFEVSTDYGQPRDGRKLLGFVEQGGGGYDSEYGSMACGVTNRRYPRRTVWLGFNLKDVWSNWDAKRLIEYVLRYLYWDQTPFLDDYQKLSRQISIENKAQNRADSDLLNNRRMLRQLILNEFTEMLENDDIESAEKMLNEVEARAEDIYLRGLAIEIKRIHNIYLQD